MNNETVREPHHVLNDHVILTLTSYSNPSWAKWQDVGAGYYKLVVAESVDRAWDERRAKEKLASWGGSVTPAEMELIKLGFDRAACQHDWTGWYGMNASTRHCKLCWMVEND